MEQSLSRRTLFTRVASTAPQSATRLAVIASTCLAENGAYCRTCAETCPEGAIRFHLLPRGRARADVETDRCTGCGDCLASCPVDAVKLTGEVEPCT
ncbi:4Fe-4S dicluster domain-containing protein [Niveispirillum fermenti]|uniref:4Fe-4S dicluster domain-containing protein n=1 Tax=Niveispirillum fermenti TaxID=1233113 RepID=UPI003A856B72